jgi:hypothetical protein
MNILDLSTSFDDTILPKKSRSMPNIRILDTIPEVDESCIEIKVNEIKVNECIENINRRYMHLHKVKYIYVCDDIIKRKYILKKAPLYDYKKITENIYNNQMNMIRDKFIYNAQHADVTFSIPINRKLYKDLFINYLYVQYMGNYRYLIYPNDTITKYIYKLYYYII